MEFLTVDEIPGIFAKTGWTQKEFAKFIGATPNTVGTWLRGHDVPSSIRPDHREKLVELRTRQLEAKP